MTRRATLLILGLLAIVAGALWLGALMPNHIACSDSAIESVNYSACQSTDIRFMVALVLIFIGVVCALVAVLKRDE